MPLARWKARVARAARLGLAAWALGFGALSTLAACDGTPLASAASDPPREGRYSAPPSEFAKTSPDERESALGADLFQFATAVSRSLNDRDAFPPPNNSYSHETAYSRSDESVPYISLKPTESYSALSCTNCSGWVSFAVNTISPLHHAVLQSQRHRDEYNRDYGGGFRLRESKRTWARAFVLTNFFRSRHAFLHGFEPLRSHEHLRPGDLVAYSLGRYIDPENANLRRPADTGHTFIVAGPTSLVDPATPDYDARGTLSEDAEEVIAVPVIDASSIPHFDPDTRKNERGRFTLPRRAPGIRLKPGGIGRGTVWFALDEHERVIQRRLGPRGTFRDCKIGAVRLGDAIVLDHEILDAHDELVIDNFNNVPARYDGVLYGGRPIDLLGYGGIRLVGGRLVLGGRSSFSGGVTIENGWLVVASDMALGTGDLEVRGGYVHVQQPALDDNASLRLSPDLKDGSVRLNFRGQDEIWSLEIGGNLYGCGSWGSPESGALFTDPRFSGPGQLYLTSDDPSRCTGARAAASRR